MTMKHLVAGLIIQRQRRMKTAQQVINKAARLAGVLDPNQTLNSTDADDYLESLNDLLAQLKNSGIDFGVDTLALADNVIIVESDYNAIQYLLAVLIRDENRMQPDMSLISKAI